MKTGRRGFLGMVAAAIVAPKVVKVLPAASPAGLKGLTDDGAIMGTIMSLTRSEWPKLLAQPYGRPTMFLNEALMEEYLKAIRYR